VNKLAMATVFAVFATLLPRAYAGVPGNPLCCACLPAELAQTSGNRTAQTALFCAPSAVGSEEALLVRCAAEPVDAKLSCFNTLDNSSCSAGLAEFSINCPGATAAPTASPLNLATLAVSLAAVGALLLHRRRRA
jgi:MYXO-CTERM domain-containing protein